MPRNDSTNSALTGVYQLENGMWGYRYTVTRNGKKKDVKKTKDDMGRSFKTDKAAFRARELAIAREKEARAASPAIQRLTFAEVYGEYCLKGRSGKAYNTVLKQDSLWRNHLQAAFGARYVDEISVAEVNDYLARLYFDEGRAYRYVEGFLKMFYLIFGQAYLRNFLDVDRYNKLCVNKDTRIRMPKLKADEDMDIVVFSREELETMDAYFSGTNAETAYMLGRCCGLRINECYGLKWANVDLDGGTILIDRQMQYQNGLIKLVPVKTRNGRRTVFMSSRLKVYFQKLAARHKADEERMQLLRLQNQKLIEDLDGKTISSTELVNSLPDGKIQTVNSMKYHTRELKKRYGIEFKYHYLRHTYGTRMAELNTPTHLLCNQMGHGNIKVTQRYYIALSQTGVEILKSNLNRL